MLNSEQKQRLKEIGKMLGMDLLGIVERQGRDATKVLEALEIEHKAKGGGGLATGTKVIPRELDAEQEGILARVGQATGVRDLLSLVRSAYEAQDDDAQTSEGGAKVLGGRAQQSGTGAAQDLLQGFVGALAKQGTKGSQRMKLALVPDDDPPGRNVALERRIETNRKSTDAFRGDHKLVASTGQRIKAARPASDLGAEDEAIARILRPQLDALREAITQIGEGREGLAEQLAVLSERLNAIDGGAKGLLVKLREATKQAAGLSGELTRDDARVVARAHQEIDALERLTLRFEDEHSEALAQLRDVASETLAELKEILSRLTDVSGIAGKASTPFPHLEPWGLSGLVRGDASVLKGNGEQKRPLDWAGAAFVDNMIGRR